MRWFEDMQPGETGELGSLDLVMRAVVAVPLHAFNTSHAAG